MHAAALQLAPILAEKSKTPFYIAGGVLVLWALLISMGIGMRNPGFPTSLGQQRLVMAITVVLVLFAVSMAVATSGGEKKSQASAAPAAAATSTATAPAPAQSTPSQPAPSAGTPPAGSSPAGARSSLKLAAAPQGELAFDTKTLTAKAGGVTITFTNASPVEHDVTIAQGGKVLGATPKFIGGAKTLTLNLKPGTYTFYCSVPGHRQAGMEGTLTVS
jgi:plastocyanin